MKTSQYILLSFLGFVFAATLVLFADSKNGEKVNGNVFGETIPETRLEAFSVIVAEKKANITIKNDSVNSMSALLFQTDSVFQLPEYKIINDTLFISKSGYAAKTIIKCHAVKTIIGRSNSNIQLGNYKTDSLSIYLDKSRVNGWIKNSPMDFVTIEALNKSNLSLTFNRSSINMSKLKVDNSSVNFFNNNSSINQVSAVLSSKANMRLIRPVKLDVNCDLSSRYWINN